MFGFRQPSVVVRDPETLKQLTIKDFEYFENKQLIGNKTDKLLVSFIQIFFVLCSFFLRYIVLDVLRPGHGVHYMIVIHSLKCQ